MNNSIFSTAPKKIFRLTIRPHIHASLKGGITPSSENGGSIIPGLLPETGVLFRDRYASINFSVRSLLFEMALDSGDPDEVLQWYSPNTHKNTIRSEASPVDRIADVVVVQYPCKAIEIWKQFAEKIIDMKNPDFYQHAVMYLIKIRDTSLKIGKSTEFSDYILHLKKEHARKRRFIQELGVVERRKSSTICDFISCPQSYPDFFFRHSVRHASSSSNIFAFLFFTFHCSITSYVRLSSLSTAQSANSPASSNM